MSGLGEEDRVEATPAQIAEAAAWIAHLHGSRRTADSERGLQLWLQAHPNHKRLWEIATEMWEEAGSIQRPAMTAVLRMKPRRRWVLAATWVATAATLLVAVVGSFLLLMNQRISTGAGEQRTVVLDDGTRVTLNTRTQVAVHYSRGLRRVDVENGEVIFEVAKQPERPFVVTSEQREIRALGTSFVVRDEDEALSVTLIEGTVRVTPAKSKMQSLIASLRDSEPEDACNGMEQRSRNCITLVPGERISFLVAREPTIDRPDIQRMTAWKHGKVIFEGVTIEDAIKEMNRYSDLRLSVDTSGLQDVRVSGVFQVGDSLSFARAVAATYGLQVIRRDMDIIICDKLASK
jgi:transmembrane sensor